MNKVDIIIPTYNRPDLLARVLDYYSQTGREFNFIVVDSSNLEIKARNKKLVSSYNKLKILYINNFPQNLQQHIKFAKLVKYVKSKYCVFCADDDFIVPSGIKKCIDFLEKNPSYVAAHGSYIGFYLYKGLFGYKNFWWNFRYSHHSVIDDSPEKRMTSHLNNFTLLIWAVRRSDVVKECYKELLKTDFDPYLLLMYGELLPDILTAIFGRVKRINTFYGARQYFFSIATNYSTLLDAYNTPKYNTEYTKFKNTLVRNVFKIKKIPKIQISKLIDLSMEKYLKYSYQEYLINKLNKFLRPFPILQKGFRLLHASYLLSKNKRDQIGMINNTSSKHFKSFEDIRKSVIKHNI